MLTSQLEALADRVRAWETEEPRGASAVKEASGLTPRDASTVRSRVHGFARASATERGAASEDAETGEAAAGSGLEAQVGEIDKELVRLGGVDCGWDALEHAAYMRLRTQLLGPAIEGKPKPRYGPRSDGKLNRLIQRAARELPGRDEATVEEHEAHVARREELVRERRELLKQWRQAREEARQHAIEDVESEPKADARASAPSAAVRRREEAAELERQKQLEAWRERKMAQRAEAEAAKAAEEKAKADARKAETKRHEAMRQAVLERAAEREAEKQALAAVAAQEKREQAGRARQQRQLQLMTLQQRDATLARSRREATAEARRDEAGERAKRIEELGVTARPSTLSSLTRDASRLSQPTQAHAARVNQQREASSHASPAMHGRPMQRAVPAWRRGL